MKYFILLFFTIIASLILPAQLVFAPPSPNPDWSNYPYCPGGCPHNYLKEAWAKYYDLKGFQWMENKKQELQSVMSNGTLREWIDNDPTSANGNVYLYYWTQNQIPNFDGEYFDQIPSCDDSKALHPDDLCYVAKEPPCPVPTNYKAGLCVIEYKNLCTLDFTDYCKVPDTFTNPILLILLIAITAVIAFFVVRRKRK